MTKRTMTAQQRAAQTEIAKLERAQFRAKAPDARRILDEERVELMAAAQRLTGQELSAAVARAARVREMWAGY